MRRTLIIGLPLLILAAAAGAWFLLHPRDPIGSAKQRMARGDVHGAELYLRQAVREHPMNAEAAFLLGVVDLSLGNPKGAALELTRARDRGYSHGAIVLPLGQAYLEQRQFDAALREFDPAHAPADERADILTIRAAAQLSLGDSAAATASIREAEALAPTKRETIMTAARIALAQGDIAGAASRAAQVLEKTPNDPDALLLQSDLAMDRHDPHAALADAQKVLATNPGRLDARMVEARALATLGQIGPARASVARVLQGSPRNTGANFLGAMLALEAKDYSDADRLFNQLTAIVSDLPRGDFFLAVTKLGVGQPAQAEEAISRFLAKNPDDLAGLKLMVFVDLARRRPAAALDLLHQSKLAGSTDSDTLDLTGRAQAMSGDMAAARSSFAEASKLAPRDANILNHLAAVQMNLGDSSAAATELKRSLQIAPDQPPIGEALVQASLARGDVAGAAASVDRLRQTTGDTESVGMLDAEVKQASLDLDGAQSQLLDVLKRFPDSRTAALFLVRLYAMRGNQAAAEAQLEALIRRHPDDQGALSLLLPTLFMDNQADEAVKTAEAAHAAAPDNTSITAALAAAYVRAHQAGRASALLDRASAAADPQLRLLRARVLAADGKRDQAEQIYRDVLLQNPGDTATRADLARLLAADKHFDDARAVLHDGLAQSPGNATLLDASIGADLLQGGIKQALADVAALQADPRNLPAANALAGDAWLATGDRKQAAAAFAAAYHAAPSSELAIRAAGTLSEIGDNDQATTLLAGWVAGHRQDVAAQSVLSSLYIDAHKLDEAEQQLNAVLAVRPNDATILNNLAWVKQQKGDPAAARLLAQRAYFQSPVPVVADTLGWIIAKAGDPQHALPLLAQAAGNPNEAARGSAEYHYGYALNAAGRHDEARSEFQKATQIKANFPEKAEAQRLLAGMQ
jgi:putative PEP-CTERM system TPR-repeat lipoprotein